MSLCFLIIFLQFSSEGRLLVVQNVESSSSMETSWGGLRHGQMLPSDIHTIFPFPTMKEANLLPHVNSIIGPSNFPISGDCHNMCAFSHFLCSYKLVRMTKSLGRLIFTIHHFTKMSNERSRSRFFGQYKKHSKMNSKHLSVCQSICYYLEFFKGLTCEDMKRIQICITLPCFI